VKWLDTRLTKKRIISLSIQSEKDLTNRLRKKSAPFTIATNNIKNLGATLKKQVKDLSDNNFESLKKKRSPMLMDW
jgi:secreted Zn-dependent insulinase-like peptidase